MVTNLLLGPIKKIDLATVKSQVTDIDDTVTFNVYWDDEKLNCLLTLDNLSAPQIGNFYSQLPNTVSIAKFILE